MDKAAVDMGLKHLHGVRDPFDERHNFYVLLETTGSNDKHDQLSRTKAALLCSGSQSSF